MRARTAAIFTALIVAFVPVALARFIDADEGYLLYAARLVAEGRHPYGDFFFPQPPALPFALAALLHPVGWIGGRLVAAVLAATTGTLVAIGLRRRGLEPWAEWAGALVFASTALAFGWLPIVKTYALATPLLYGAHLLVRGEEKRPSAAAVLFALAVATRLYLLGLVPLFVLPLLRRRLVVRFAVVLTFTLGATLAVMARWAPPDVLAFDLVGYHAHLQPMSAHDALAQKWLVLRQLLGFEPIDRALGLQLLALSALATLGVVRRRWDAAHTFTLALFALTLLPRPTYVQYFSIAAPFLVELAIVGVTSVRVPRIAWAGAAAAYAALAAIEARRHTSTADLLIGIADPEARWQWRIGNVRRVSSWLATYRPCGPVAVTWPGYLVESELAAWPGMENHFGLLAGEEIADRSTRERIKVLSIADVEALAHAPERPRLWLVGNSWNPTQELARLGDYRPLRTADGAALLAVGCTP